ncbi:MAG TPA: DinB family protein [Gemmatimonadaceae bacterium]|nr:DinB family protein [Gemmatimonadaceae bacterium]
MVDEVGGGSASAALARELQRAIDDAGEELAQRADADTAHRPAPGKWSAREILGHLIDSAAVNHERFVRAQGDPDLVYPPYDQEAWVTLQGYHERSWASLYQLWRAYNLHLTEVVARIPEQELMRPRVRHNLDRIAWRAVPADTPATLAYLVRDYVDHLRHHLAQIAAVIDAVRQEPRSGTRR